LFNQDKHFYEMAVLTSRFIYE